MRFGISEISWTLPKILRMRRELVLSPLVVLRGASIALVAIVFPALEPKLTQRSGSPTRFFGVGRSELGALPPVFPLQCVWPVRWFGPCPGEDGKGSGAHVTVRRSRLFVGLSRYN